MPNTISSHLLSGSCVHPSQNGHHVVDAINRGGNPLADHTLFVPGSAFLTTQIVGSWSSGLGSNGVPYATKAAAAEIGHVILPIQEATRNATERGLELFAATLNYAVATAALTDLTLQITDYDGSVADGSEPNRAILAGDVDAHYDVAHDTAAERGAISTAEKLTVTIPTPTSFLAGYHSAALEIFATDPGTSVFTIHGVTLLFRRVDLDVIAPS